MSGVQKTTGRSGCFHTFLHFSPTILFTTAAEWTWITKGKGSKSFMLNKISLIWCLMHRLRKWRNIWFCDEILYKLNFDIVSLYLTGSTWFLAMSFVLTITSRCISEKLLIWSSWSPAVGVALENVWLWRLPVVVVEKTQQLTAQYTRVVSFF